MTGFARIELPPELTDTDWVNTPELFSQHLSAALWATNQIDPFEQHPYATSTTTGRPHRPRRFRSNG